MNSLLKRCLLFLVVFVLRPVRGHSPHDDSGAVQLLVVVVIVVGVLLGLVLYRCIKESNETDNEVGLESLGEDGRNGPAQIYSAPSGRIENNFRHFGGYGNQYQRRKLTLIRVRFLD